LAMTEERCAMGIGERDMPYEHHYSTRPSPPHIPGGMTKE
jgi:hypothetical protein